MAIDSSFLHQLDRFSLIINKRITSNYMGERQANSTGRGLIFRDHQQYAPGEDFRTVDWRVFARTDRLFMKRYEEERNLTVHVLVYFSASMNFGTKVTKADYAAMVGLGFAYMALKNNERFVLSTFADQLELFKPRKGRKQLVSILDYLNDKKPKGATDLLQAMSNYRKVINTKSMIVIVSDFLYPIDHIRSALYQFKDHDLILIQVLDKGEKELDLEGDFKLRDLESDTVLRTFISPYGRKKYGEMLASHIAAVQKVCDEVGAQFYSADTGQTVFDVFYNVLNYRQR